MDRGLDWLDIYREDGDREHMLELPGVMSERYGVQVHGCVLMSNHYHLLMKIRSGNLSAAVHWLKEEGYVDGGVGLSAFETTAAGTTRDFKTITQNKDGAYENRIEF